VINAGAQALLEFWIPAAASDVFGDRCTNDIGNGALVNVGHGLQLISLLRSQPDGHGFRGFHSYLSCHHSKKVVKHQKTVESWYQLTEVNMSNQGQGGGENSGPGGGNPGQGGRPDHGVKIRIDRESFTVHEEFLSGGQLRALPNPAIGTDRDLFKVVPGGSDKKIELTDRVEMRPGLRFFTAPAQINPGQG